MTMTFEADPYLVKFPISKDNVDVQYVTLRRPIAMPLKEMNGTLIKTLGYDDDQDLLGFQYVDKPHKINYAYPVKKELFNTFIGEFNKGMTEKEMSDFIISHFLVVEEPCMVYSKDHNPVNDIKYKKA